MRKSNGTVLNACRTKKQLPRDFIDLYASSAIRPSQDLFKIFEIAIEYTTKEEQTICEYVVQHAMMASSGDGDMDKWARERKMFPWVAVAAPLIVSHLGLEYCPSSIPSAVELRGAAAILSSILRLISSLRNSMI